MSTAAAPTGAAPAAPPKEKAPAAAAGDVIPDSAPDSDVSPSKKPAAATAAQPAAAATAAPPPPKTETGVVLFCGGTDWATIGRSGGGGGGGKASGKQQQAEADADAAAKYPLLPLPVRLAALEGVKVTFIAAGPAAAHCIAGDDQGRVWTWGRNERGQLGHGDFKQYNAPTLVTALQSKNVHAVGATAGKSHTVVWARDGSSWAWGLNTQGQLGIGSISTVAGGAAKKAAGAAAQDDVRMAPQRVAVDGFVASAAAGALSTVWLTRNGKVFVSLGFLSLTRSLLSCLACLGERGRFLPFSFSDNPANATPPTPPQKHPFRPNKTQCAGHPENGRLGTGTDYMYNTKDSSIKIAYRPQPRPLEPAGEQFRSRTIRAIAAGTAHVLAADSEGWLWSWGCGNYGVLGHKVQQDEMRPRRVEAFSGRLLVVPDSPLAAGTTSSFAVGVGPQLFAWGKLKTNGDSFTAPTPLTDLSGWNIRQMSCGPGTFAVAADSSCIAWGASVSGGELGQGPGGKKSSANPVKVDALDGAHCIQTAAGVGFTMFLLRTPDARAEAAELWSPPAGDVEEAAAAAEEEGGAAGGAAGGAGPKRGRPAGKSSGGGAGAKKGKK
jgi:alpha-tubulin suppressor-like RCC1 family protein